MKHSNNFSNEADINHYSNTYDHNSGGVTNDFILHYICCNFCFGCCDEHSHYFIYDSMVFMSDDHSGTRNDVVNHLKLNHSDCCGYFVLDPNNGLSYYLSNILYHYHCNDLGYCIPSFYHSFNGLSEFGYHIILDTTHFVVRSINFGYLSTDFNHHNFSITVHYFSIDSILLVIIVIHSDCST